jgi:crotonobetainyl-CoA:carnitine CoA-transferase CaiB-like acyl-CoA transferase
VSATTDAQAARVLTLLGEDTPDGRARFGQSTSRLQHADELDALFARWVAGHRRDVVLALLLDARLPAAPVNDVATIVADQQVIARGDVATLNDDRLGPVRMVAPVPRLSVTPGSIDTTGPAIGADNRSVYGELLGLSTAELDDLGAAGVI